MNLVATLIANPSEHNLNQELVGMVADRLAASRTKWLAQNIACDVFLPPNTRQSEAEALLQELLKEDQIDYAVQAIGSRKKKLLVADMDSTMIDQECIDELAAEVGLKEQVAKITSLAMNGEIPFEEAVHERVALLAGLPTSVVGEILRNRITIAKGACNLVRTMNIHGARTVLVSGGFTVFTSKIAEIIGFDEHYANELLTEDDKFTGKVRLPVLGADAKVETLNNTAATLNIDASDAIAVGDGANDLPMLLASGTGVALHAKQVVADKAKLCVQHGTLESLLYIQGYEESEIVKN